MADGTDVFRLELRMELWGDIPLIRAAKAEALLAKIARWARYRASAYPQVQFVGGDEPGPANMQELAVQDMLDIARMAEGDTDR